MVTSVIYARIPETLKGAVDAFADERGMSVTSAVCDLLGRGLEAAGNEESVHKLEVEVATLRAERKAMTGRLRDAETLARETLKREETVTNANRSLAERMRQQVGECPKCRIPVTGEDLLVATQCQEGHSLASLLGGTKPEYLFLVGAVGVLAGIAMAQSTGG